MSKTAVILGGTGYLGQALDKALTARGYAVRSFGSKDIDLTDEKSILKAAEALKQSGAQIDLLIHSAAPTLNRKPLLSSQASDIQNQFDIQVFGPRTFIAAIASLFNKDALLVGVSSQAVDMKTPMSGSAYVTAKYAMGGLFKTLGAELEGKGVTTFVIAPPFMPEGLNSDLPESVKKIVKANSAPGDYATADEVAAAFVKLLDEPRENIQGKHIDLPNSSLRRNL